MEKKREREQRRSSNDALEDAARFNVAMATADVIYWREMIKRTFHGFQPLLSEPLCVCHRVKGALGKTD